MNKAILITILAIIAAALPAAGQARFGLRAGVSVDKLRFDRDIIDSNHRLGYSGGVVLDLNIPVVGLGFEASAMYTYRNSRLTDGTRSFKRHYIDIPVYARYRMALPTIERVCAPLVFTGPSFSILFSDDAPSGFKNSKTYMSWDVGAGVDLFRHLRITATYGIGMSKALEYIDSQYNGPNVHGKDKTWTLSAAVLF